MKKRNKLIMIMIFWTLVIAALYSQGLTTIDFHKMKVIIGNNPIKMRCLFVFLSTVRVAFFIPQTIFIIGGSMIFGPYEGFILSVLSLVISQTIMYAVGRLFQKQLLGENFLEKNKEITTILKKYGYKVLALGIACPVTPSDLLTVSASLIKLNYKKCIAVIVMADTPMIFLYGFLGTRFEGSIALRILALITIAFISYYTFYMWNKIKNLKVS